MEECDPNTFIDYWKKAYDEAKYDWKDYLSFMNMNIISPLSSEYVLRACQWKKGREWKKGVQPENFGKNWSNYVKCWMDKKVLEYLEYVRDNEERIETIFKKLDDFGTFQTVRMQSFIVHTVKPFEFPILDVNVWKSFEYLNNGLLKDKQEYKIDDYISYKNFFDNLAKQFEKDIDKSKDSFEEILRKRKDIDDALMAFGRFIDKYWMLINKQ